MDDAKKHERVLVIGEDLMYGFGKTLEAAFPFSKVWESEQDLQWLDYCLGQACFMPRGLVEENPKYKQLIPYIVVKSGNKILSYERAGAEERLSGKVSVGIGGHVNLEDFFEGRSRFAPEGNLYILENAADREINEELGLDQLSRSSQLRCMAGLSNPSGILFVGDGDMVNAVHLGVVYQVSLGAEVESDWLAIRDEGINTVWRTKEELLEIDDRLETWSSVVVRECL